MIEIWGKYTSKLKKSDLHMHTNGSGDAKMDPSELPGLAVEVGLNKVAVTDHNNVVSAKLTKEYGQRQGYKVEIIVGSEISSKDGHVIGIDLEEDIEQGLSVEETIRQIHKQGGLVIVPHPMYTRIRSSLGEKRVLSILNNPDLEIYLDGYEVYNAGVDIKSPEANDAALAFYKKYVDGYAHKLGAAVGGSDGHFYTVGRGLTGYDGNLRNAILDKKTRVFSLDGDEQIELLSISEKRFGNKVEKLKKRYENYLRERFKIKLAT